LPDKVGFVFFGGQITNSHFSVKCLVLGWVWSSWPVMSILACLPRMLLIGRMTASYLK